MEILKIVGLILIAITFVLIVIQAVVEMILSNRFYKRLEAECELFSATAKREHELRHAVVEFGDWLMDEFEKAKNEMNKKPNKYNDGKLTATQDIVGTFLNTLEECIGDWDEEDKD